MPFEIGGNTARLEFAEGTALDGATVRVSRDMSLRDYMGLKRILIEAEELRATGNDPDEVMRFWTDRYCEFGATFLLSWDLIFNGSEIPATAEGMQSLPAPVADAIYAAWLRSLTEPLPNSPAVSANGALSEAEAVVMAAS